MTRLRGAAETHTGYVRSINQDLALVSGDLVAVADGMGGHLGGEVAARTAIEELLEAYVRDRTSGGLERATRRANRAVWRQSRVDRKLHGMGTTLTAAALVGTGPGDPGPARLVLVNVGDSRAYVFDSETRSLLQLTEDHSVVEEMVRQGELTHEEAAVHPHRHVLTRALGIDADVSLDIWELIPHVGSRYLLCSDGLTNEVPDDEIAGVLATAAEPREAARELVGRALGHGGMDNVTVVVVDIVDGDEDPAEVPVVLVPPRPPRPEVPVRDHVDITEVIPISGPGRQPDPGGAPSGALGNAETDPSDPPGGSWSTAVGDAPGDDPPGDAQAGPGAGGAGSGAASALDASTQLQPTIGPDDDEVAVAAVVGAAAGGAATVAAGATDVTAPPGASDALDAPPGSRPVRRGGRSMTVRQRPTPPPIDGSIGLQAGAGGFAAAGGSTGIAAGPITGSGRPVVLVPTRQRNTTRDRIVTVRVAVFVVVLAGMFAGTAGVVIWFDQSSYFVALHGNSVAIYQGRPGGMLWFKPQLIETSTVKTSDLLPSSITTLRGGITESSLKAAEAVVARLKNERQNALASATTTTLRTTTTTTPFGVTTSTFPSGPPSTSTTTLPRQTTTTRPQQTTTTTQPHQTTTTATTSPTSTSSTTSTTTVNGD